MDNYTAAREMEIDDFKIDTIVINDSNLALAFSVCSVHELAQYVARGVKFFRLKNGMGYRTVCIDDIESEIARDDDFQADLNFMVRTGKDLAPIKEKLNKEIYDRAYAEISEIKADYDLV